MNAYSELAPGNVVQRALVATFIHRGNAHDAAKRLRDAGFNKVWIGVTSAYVESDDRYNTGTIGTNVDNDDTSIGAKISRFFSDEADGITLSETLMRRGVTEAEARRIDASIEPNNVLLTVDGNNHPEHVAQIVEACAGAIISGATIVETAIAWAGANAPPTVPSLHEDFFIARFEDD